MQSRAPPPRELIPALETTGDITRRIRGLASAFAQPRFRLTVELHLLSARPSPVTPCG